MPKTLKNIQGADQSTVVYRQYGSGPKLITVLHSLALDGSWYEPLAEALGSEYRLLAPDFRGHGQSTVGSTPISLKVVAQDIAAMWDAEDVQSSVVLGISLGGMVAQAVTGLYPDRVNAQILMATSGGYNETSAKAITARAAEVRAEGGLEAADETTMFRWFGEKSKDRTDPMVKRASEQFRGAGGEVIGAYFEAMTSVGNFATDAPPPTLVIGGSHDQSTPQATIEALAASTKGAQLLYANGGHLVAFENPEEVAKTIRPFLDGLASWDRA